VVRNLIGPPVTGADFFNRSREQQELWDFLHRDHVLMLAPRRVGKTSLMRRLAADGPDKGAHAVYCSAADAPDELGFIELLLAAIARLDEGVHALEALKKSPVGKFLRRVKKVDVAGFGIELDENAVGWAAIGEALTVVLGRQSGQWLLLVDELPMFVLKLLRLDPDGARAREFLGWFRGLRQRSDLDDGVRWLLAGSIGLDAVTARLHLGDTINDLHIYHLGPFSEADADGLLQQLGTTHDLLLSDDVRSHMIRRVGWLIPYHLQLLFGQLRSHCRDEDREPSIAAVDAAYEELLTPAHKSYFDYWRQRLHEELGKPDASFALALLAAIARDESGVTRDTLRGVLSEHVGEPLERDEKLRYLLDVLEGDGYLASEAGRLRFRSPLVREFWIRRVLP